MSTGFLKSPMVAVLEDELQIRAALHRLVASHGFRVENCRQADETALLAAIQSATAKPDVLHF